MMPKIKTLRELITCDAEAGLLFWRERAARWFKHERFAEHWNGRWAGQQIGTPDAAGYLVFNLLGRSQKVHRVIYAMAHGVESPAMIDHVNGVRDDNRISNLRAASHEINSQNVRRASNKTGLPMGVFPNGCGRFFARLQHRGQRVYLGTFDDPSVAHAAYLKTKRELHEGCTI